VAILLGLYSPIAGLDSIEGAISKYYEEHGKLPASSSGDSTPYTGATVTWKSVDGWLRYYTKTTLARFCEKAGFKDRLVRDHKELLRQRVQQFFDEHGRRPGTKEMPNENAWLTRRGSSLRKMCDELGLPGLSKLPEHFRTGRTEDSCRQELIGFYREHARPPVPSDVPNVYGWLHRKGVSWTRFCREAGIPDPGKGRAVGRHRRTVERCARKIRAFHKEHDRRPRSCDMPNVARWLLDHAGTSLQELCDELGLPPRPKKEPKAKPPRPKKEPKAKPPRPKKEPKAKPPPVYVMGRTRESCREELRRFHEQQGRPPSPRDVPKIYQWLHRHGIAWTEFCDDAGLPARKKGRPRVSSESW
jgi:hypothetical protein